MAVLRPLFTPTLGTPQPVVATRRPRNMTERLFYQQKAQPKPQQEMPDFSSVPTFQSAQQTRDQPVPPPEFEQSPITGDYIQEQLGRIKQSAGPPVLEPGSRVQSANAELVQPSEFQVFYEQLAAIDRSGQEMLGAAVARSAFQRAQAMAAANQTPNSGGSQSRQTGGGQAYGNGIPSNPAANFKFAQQVAPQFGWSGKELSAWYTLGMKESGWRNTAQNPTSTAYGIGQFLNSTWAGVGIAKTSDPYLQVLAMARYIKNRYGSPSRALAFHYANNWY